MNLHFQISHHPVINQTLQIFHVPRVWRKLRSSLRATATGGARRAKSAAKRAYHTGIVKNQQCSVSELLQTKARLRPALLFFSQSRDK
jgi:hypothetical protein